MLIQKSERKTILILDNNSELEQLVKEPIQKHLEKLNSTAVLVRARDGADAASKSENQKFDVVLIDTEVPRLMDGGFVRRMKTYKNTSDASLVVISHKDLQDLPESLSHSKHFKKPFDANAVVEAMIAAVNQGEPPPINNAPSTSKFAVDVRVINAIIKATSSVLEKMGVSGIKMEKAMQKSAHEELSGEISSYVDIKSTPFRGLLTISFDKSSFLEVASAMLMEEQTELNEFNQDAAGEINNIIFGNAKAELASYGVEMTIPKILIGAHQTIQCPSGSGAMCIPFQTKNGKFYLTVIAIPTN